MMARLYKDFEQQELSLGELSDKGCHSEMKDEGIQAFFDECYRKTESKSDKEASDGEDD